jgi:hypothetical protein
MRRYFLLAGVLLSSTVSFARCDREFQVWKEKQGRLEDKKTVRNVSGVVGIFFWPAWIVTGVTHRNASRMKKDVAHAEMVYQNCMNF